MPTLLPPISGQSSDPARSPHRITKTDSTERLTRVLLVEDEPLTAEVFARALTRDGHQVEIARDGLQALNRLRNRVPSVIILDMNLPALPGSEVVRRLRAAGHHEVPVIVVSGSSQAVASIDADTLAPGRWIEKPIKPRDLVRIVREFVQAS